MNMIVPYIRENATPFLDDMEAWIEPDHPARIIAMFVDTLHLSALGFRRQGEGADRLAEPHPATMLKLFIFGFLNRVPSSRCLARETSSNIECVWLTGNHMLDRAALASFRRTNRDAIVHACARFMLLWKKIKSQGHYVAKAGSLQRQQAKVARYITRLNRVDDHEDSAIDALRLDSPANRERRLQQDFVRFAAGKASACGAIAPSRPARLGA